MNRKKIGLFGAIWIASIASSFVLGSKTVKDRTQDVQADSSTPARATRSAPINARPGRSAPSGKLMSRIERIDSLGKEELESIARELVVMEPLSARWELLGRLCGSLNQDNWRVLVDAFRQDTAETGRTRPREYELLITSLGERVGKDAMVYWLEADKSNWHAAKVMEGWARSSPDEAIAFVEANKNLAKGIRESLISGIARSDPQRAFELSFNTKDSVALATSNAIEAFGIEEAVNALNLALDKGGDANGVKTNEYMDVVADSVFTMGKKADDPALVCQWLESMYKDGGVPPDYLARGSLDYAAKKPAEAIDWWLTMVPNEQQKNPEWAGAGALYQGIMKGDPTFLREWLVNNPNHPCYDSIAGRYVVDKRAGDAYGSQEIIGKIVNPKTHDYISKQLAAANKK